MAIGRHYLIGNLGQKMRIIFFGQYFNSRQGFLPQKSFLRCSFVENGRNDGADDVLINFLNVLILDDLED